MSGVLSVKRGHELIDIYMRLNKPGTEKNLKRRGIKMQMSEQEICKTYRESKNPNQQLTILAQLNACSTEDILSILEKNNEPLRKRPYQRSQKPEKVSPKKTGKKEEEIPDTVRRAILYRMDCIEAKKEEHYAALKDLEEEFKQLNQFLKKQTKEGSNDKRNDVCETSGSELSGSGKEEGKTEEVHGECE